MWCDFGANLVQHFIKRYSRYSRYRTKTHDKATISNGTLKTRRDNHPFGIISIYKKLCCGRAFCFAMLKICRERPPGRPVCFTLFRVAEDVDPYNQGGTICKNSAVLFTFEEFNAIMALTGGRGCHIPNTWTRGRY